MTTVAAFDVKPYETAGLSRHADEKGFAYKFYETKLTSDTAELARGCDAVCVFVNDELSKDALEKLSALGIRLVALRCAGYNNVDLSAAKEAGITVVRVPSYSPHAVAEHAIAMLLTLVRRTHKAYIRTRDFNFSLTGLVGTELYGKTCGIVGTGKIGKVMASLCRGFGMKVIAYDAYPDKQSGINYVSADTLFRESDVISLHCPLTKETKHLISRDSISVMKKGVILINTSRGALIDAEALLTAIKEKRVGGACLDVYEEEGDIFFTDRSGHIMTDDTLARLISMPNVLVTSHQAFLTEEALSAIAETTATNIDLYFRGELANEVK